MAAAAAQLLGLESDSEEEDEELTAEVRQDSKLS